ncbi:MAG TPA: dephospho-CoA kinase [Chthoniobacterales bacterium]|nr:dephospho-CoA kinase [Chthoniobacterales bacterium]
MPAIGITGGISTGKTTFCDLLKQLIPAAIFFDADQAARSLTATDPGVRKEIEEVFGKNLYSAEGNLNRAELRAIILASGAKRRALEQILHPRIRSQWSAEAKRHRNSFFFADIPLLYETGGETLCDRVVVVACSPDVQLQRLLARRSPAGAGEAPTSRLSRTEAIEMIKTQMPLAEKIRKADHLVWNNDGQPILEAQTRDLVKLWTGLKWIVK